MVVAAAGAGPTLNDLVALSSQVYSGNKSVPGYKYLGDNYSIDGDPTGFRAAAYINSASGKNIIVAFQGTDSLKDFLSDGSYVTGAPDKSLETSVSEAAMFLKKIEARYPGYTISLTGHSLGGAIASMLAERTGLSATIFDAPGAQDLYNSMVGEISGILPYSSPGPITQYRLSTDEFSFVGQQFAQTTTYSLSGGQNYFITGNTTADFLLNSSAILGNHSISLLATLVTTGATPIPGYTSEPNLLVGDALIPVQSNGQLTVLINDVDPTVNYLIDPAAVTEFSLIGSANSPVLAQLELPTSPGVFDYELKTLTSGVWSMPYKVSPGSAIDFSSNVSGIWVEPLDDMGTDVALINGLDFGITFQSTGTFSGALSEVTSGVPEPSTWIMLLVGFALSGYPLRSSAYRRRQRSIQVTTAGTGARS